MKNIIVTGGAGFIGSALVRYILLNTSNKVINIDKLTYAGNLDNLQEVSDSENYTFEKADICDEKKITNIFDKYKPDYIMHLAAESHVDKSINGPYQFIKTNILGTYTLLKTATKFFSSLDNKKKNLFRFHHVSTDEVFGDLHTSNDLFTEDTPYKPSSPYSATKASSDHLVRAWQRTFNLPTLISNCSNNYGPFHYPEKLIPLTILKIFNCKNIPVYGNGEQIRDWLYVEDHAEALFEVVTRGVIGETYNIGGNNEYKNIDVIKTICKIMEDLYPIQTNKNTNKSLKCYEDLITYVDDRPGHDLRYAIDSTKIKNKLNWQAKHDFETGILKTVKWYLDNLDWVNNIDKRQ